MSQVHDRPEEGRFEIEVDGEVAGFAEYRAVPEGRAFDHTVIDERFRGRGLAEQLVTAALDATRREGLLVEPYCPFVRRFIADRPTYLDLVAEDQRGKFGLGSGEG